MGWSLLIIIVIIATAIWPMGRWALKDNGDTVATGFWVSLTVAFVAVR